MITIQLVLSKMMMEIYLFGARFSYAFIHLADIYSASYELGKSTFISGLAMSVISASYIKVPVCLSAPLFFNQL